MEHFKIGDEVVCIDVDGFDGWENFLTKGNTYKIVRILSDPDIIYIIDNTKNGFGYKASRFKKVFSEEEDNYLQNKIYDLEYEQAEIINRCFGWYKEVTTNNFYTDSEVNLVRSVLNDILNPLGAKLVTEPILKFF